MITTKLPGSVKVSVDLPGAPFDQNQVVSIDIEQGEGQHDAATLIMNGIHAKGVTAYLDRPLRIDLELNAYARMSFSGYVNHIEPESQTRLGFLNGSPIQQARIFCLGASRIMRGKRTRVWSGYTLAELVASLAERYRFSYSAPADAYRTRFLQRSESDFELLVKAAAALGYKVTCHGTHIHVWDPAKATGRGLPWAQLTATGPTAGTDSSYQPGRILELSGSFGASGHKGDAHTKRLSFLDVDGNDLVVDDTETDVLPTTGLPVRSSVEDHYVTTANSYTEAKRLLGGLVKDNYPFHLQVTVTGIPFLVPGSLAEVLGHGGYYDGVWLVRSVKHSIVRGNYVTELALSRDTTNEAPVRIASVSVAQRPPEPVLRGSVWRSSMTVGETYV